FPNNGYFAVYFHPPYAERGGFGDHGEAAPGLTEKLLIGKYALAFQDPVLLWQAKKIDYDDSYMSRLQVLPEQMDWKEWFVEDVVAVINAAPAGFRPQPPTELPRAKWLKDIGWVAMHSALGDADNDVWVLFKSSRYGSFSHSHADQNSFQVNAYGRALLIDSGYYPWYGSPHHTLWTRQTRAHNAVLINGRGQASSSMAARGTIEHFEQSGNLTVATAECAGAYNVPPHEEVVAQWKEHLTEPLPPMEPKALVVRRTTALVGEKSRPWIAVHDYLKTDGPAEFDYMLHSLEEMELDQEQGRVTVRHGDAVLDIFLLCEGELDFRQSGEFPVAPEERYEGAPEQWHLAAHSREKTDEIRFLAVMVPRRTNEEPLEVKRLDQGELRGFQVGREKVLAWWGEGEAGGSGRMLIEYYEKGEMKRKWLQ
ncbi:heparinase II/III-family protein, partial [Gemmatimonadota bacterium]